MRQTARATEPRRCWCYEYEHEYEYMLEAVIIPPYSDELLSTSVLILMKHRVLSVASNVDQLY